MLERRIIMAAKKKVHQYLKTEFLGSVFFDDFPHPTLIMASGGAIIKRHKAYPEPDCFLPDTSVSENK